MRGRCREHHLTDADVQHDLRANEHADVATQAGIFVVPEAIRFATIFDAAASTAATGFTAALLFSAAAPHIADCADATTVCNLAEELRTADP